jgi:hypothetical protein
MDGPKFVNTLIRTDNMFREDITLASQNIHLDGNTGRKYTCTGTGSHHIKTGTDLDIHPQAQ